MTVPQQVRDTSGFAPASHHSMALCLGTLGASLLLWPIAVWGFASPLRFIAAWSAAVGGVWLLSRARRHWRLHEMEEDLNDGDGFDPERMEEAREVAHSHLPPEVLANEQYQRLRDVVENPSAVRGSQRKAWGVVTAATVEDGQLVSYTIQTMKGGLALKKVETERCQQLQALLGSGEGQTWSVKADPGSDSIVGKLLKYDLPRAVAPEIPPPPRTVEEAIAAYPKLRWRFGVDAQGNEVSSLLSKQAHVALVAETGGGKSVMAASLLEMMRPYAACWIFDGKGSDYPPNLAELGNIAWISKSPEEHIVGIRWLMDEMDERYYVSNKIKGSGNAQQAFNYPPIFVLIDELGSLRSEINQRDPKGGLEKFDYFVNQLLRKGRQCRIHLCVCSQTVRVADIPGIWQDNITQIIFFGKLSGRSALSDKIPEAIKPEILDLTRRISDNQKGRGVFIQRENSSVRPVMFQGYWAYAPGTTDMAMADGHPEVQENWRKAIESCKDLPRFYDRVGIEVEGPEWRDATVEEIADTPTVVVADDRGPIPGMEIYDPLSDDFRGATTPDRGRKRARGRGSVGAAVVADTP